MSQQEKQRTELIGLYHFAEELAVHDFIPLLTTRNIKGIDMMVSDISGSRSMTFQVETTQLWNVNQESFPVFSTPSDDSKGHINDIADLIGRIRDSVGPSKNKWWAFVPVEDGKAIRYFIAPSVWVYHKAVAKAREYLGINSKEKITSIAKRGKRKGKLLTWGSLGVVGLCISDLEGLSQDINPIKEALV
jgi:hypothetical protein